MGLSAYTGPLNPLIGIHRYTERGEEEAVLSNHFLCDVELFQTDRVDALAPLIKSTLIAIRDSCILESGMHY